MNNYVDSENFKSIWTLKWLTRSSLIIINEKLNWYFICY